MRKIFIKTLLTSLIATSALASTPSENIKKLGLSFEEMPSPAGAFVRVKCSGKTAYVSGHISRKDGKVWEGKLGKNIKTEEGKQIARAVAVDLIGTLKSHVDINSVKLIKVTSFVNSDPSFTEQHLVTNGASELFLEVFSENGKHARSAIGVAALPFNAAVEIELVLEASGCKN